MEIMTPGKALPPTTSAAEVDCSRANNAVQIPTPLRLWIDAINSKNLDALVSMMTPTHAFFVEGEPPTIGRENNRRAWRGYLTRFPGYRIHIDEAYAQADAWYLMGHTEGSHVPQELELTPSSVIWRAVLEGDRLLEWSIYPASEENRQRFGIPIGTA